MRLSPPARVYALVLGAVLLSCKEAPTPPVPLAPRPAAQASLGTTRPQVVISQVYGGGGNSGATFNRDYVELYNTGTAPADISGWKLHYASSTGSSWSNTTVLPANSVIQPGHYFLVPEATNNIGVGASLPDGDIATPGGINLAGASGKIALTNANVTLTGTCPSDASLVDMVTFGTASVGCTQYKTTPTLSNILAATRKDGGCTYTGDLSADFTASTPAPHNSASPVKVCADVVPVGPLDHVALPASGTVVAGNTLQLSATPQDVNNQTVPGATVAWSSSDEQTATVDATGKVTGISASATPVTITATATAGGITKSASAAVTVTTPAITWIDVSANTTSFPPGFYGQLFLTARVASGGTIIPATFTVQSLDPTAEIVTVGTAIFVKGAGSPVVNTKPGLQITATPIGGGTAYTFLSHAITIEAPVAADPSIYGDNDEFGDPTPASPSNPNDMLITRPQYLLSYNQSRGTPNWVSYELDARQMASGQDRCNCFSPDPNLPAEKQLFTTDYTNGGFDRGHMARSADRTAGNVDNASTFYLTNIVPQMADLNQGVWAQFENALGDSAKLGGRAVYIISGPLYSRSHGLTFIKNEGKIAIPDSTWKVAFIGPRNGGAPFDRSAVNGWADLKNVTVLAVNMPNVAGVRNDPWSKYLTTVDAIEAATGYDMLSLLPASLQDALEANDHAPVPAFAVSGAALEGTKLHFDGSTSTDADLARTDLGRTEALTYAWHFSDGATATGATADHAFADNGSYTATLVVTDAFGWADSVTQTVSVANVAPTVTLSATSATSILSGDALGVSGGFTDPGLADGPWSALVDWGNGSTSPFTLSASTDVVSASAPFFGAGSYTVTLSVKDKDGGVGSASLAVEVQRRPVPGDANPNAIDVTETDGDIMITLSSAPMADITTLDVSTVAIGPVGLSAGKKVKVKEHAKSGTSVVLRFARQDLIDKGLLTASTSELVVTGQLENGVQIVSHVPVNVH